MINNKIDDLFHAIEESEEYQQYLEISKILEKDKSIKLLIDEIKNLQQEAVCLEYKNDPKVKDINEKIEIKVKELNDKPAYQEYLNRLEEFNDILSESSNMLETYINEKI